MLIFLDEIQIWLAKYHVQTAFLAFLYSSPSAMLEEEPEERSEWHLFLPEDPPGSR